MKFIHTADLHIGKGFNSVGSKGRQLREGQLATLARIAELATAEKVDALLIAGDLFDSNEVSSGTVRKVVEILQRVSPIPVLIIAGTHDVLDQGSVYRQAAFSDAGNVKVFGPGDTEHAIANTSFHGWSNLTKEGGVHPLEDLAASTEAEAEFNVALVHASLEIESKSNPNDYLVSQEEVASSGMDYIALGHWHRKYQYSAGSTVAWYCGSPECTKYDEAVGSGQVLLVDITGGNGGKVSVESRDTGTYVWRDEQVDVAIHPPGAPLENEIKSLGGANVLLRVKLKGVLPSGSSVEAAELEEELSDSFFHLEVDASGIGYPLEDVGSLFAAGTIGSLYVEKLKALMEQADSPEQRELLYEALYLGAGYIARELEVG